MDQQEILEEDRNEAWAQLKLEHVKYKKNRTIRRIMNFVWFMLLAWILGLYGSILILIMNPNWGANLDPYTRGHVAAKIFSPMSQMSLLLGVMTIFLIFFIEKRDHIRKILLYLGLIALIAGVVISAIAVATNPEETPEVAFGYLMLSVWVMLIGGSSLILWRTSAMKGVPAVTAERIEERAMQLVAARSDPPQEQLH